MYTKLTSRVLRQWLEFEMEYAASPDDSYRLPELVGRNHRAAIDAQQMEPRPQG